MTERYRLILVLFGLFLSQPGRGQETDYPGLPTRDQNPLLQAYFIPAIPASSDEAWSFSHSLYITNTYQLDNSATETLVIDVENRRYDLQINYRQTDWRLNINLSLIDNDAGFLDQTIEGWHDIFGLPQGGRDTAINNRINLLYRNNNATILNSQSADSGLADVQLAIGRTVGNGDLWLGLELPSASGNPLFSNDGVDLALWYSLHGDGRDEISAFGSGGVVIPADDGLFQNRLNSHYLFGQIGLVYRYEPDWHFLFQLDVHGAIVKDSEVDALNDSLQGQFGLRLPAISKSHQLDLFFSEDLLPGHAPDITFSLRISARQ